MKVKWLRGRTKLVYNRPSTWLILGVRDSGKSSQLEHVGENYLDEGHYILDLFGSKDGEGLAWLRSPHVKEHKVLIVHGEAVKVETEFDTRSVEKLRIKDFSTYPLIVSANPLYSSTDDEFTQTARLTDRIYMRKSWKRLTYALIREAGNLYYSRLKITDSQIMAKAQMIYLIREARHVGLAIGIDTLRFYSIDIDIRSLSDYLLMKKLGLFGLPKDLRFLYAFIQPNTFRSLAVDEFVAVTQAGSVGYGITPEIDWHKQEKENIIKAVGLDIHYEEPLVQAEQRGKFSTLGDKEHETVISAYCAGETQMVMAERMKRSSATINNHIRYHNDRVERVGYCERCKRAKGSHYAERAQRP